MAIMLQRQIELGQLDQGQKLPPVRDMAHQMQVTPGTVARAYRVLIDDGYLEAGVGQGTYVKQLRASVLPPDNAPLSPFPTFARCGTGGFDPPWVS